MGEGSEVVSWERWGWKGVVRSWRAGKEARVVRWQIRKGGGEEVVRSGRGGNSLRYFASKVWSMVLLEIKNSGSIEIFKTKTQNWESKDGYCDLCKTYVNNLGFVSVIYMPFFIVKKNVFFYIYISVVLINIFAVNILMFHVLQNLYVQGLNSLFL